MFRFRAEKLHENKTKDYVLNASVFLLIGVGLVTLYSSSFAYAQRFLNNGLHLIIRQGLMAGAGVFLFLFASWINIERIRSWIKPLLVGTFILCILTFIPPIGMSLNGASRWINLGFTTYQPSELVKLVLPIYLAHILDKKRDSADRFTTSILPPVLVCAVFFVIIYFQNNFSTAVFIGLNALILFFLAGIKMRFFIAATVMFLPISALLLLTKEHRVRRLISFIRPEWDPQGAGYQVRNSVATISSGGLLGKGIGQGTRKISSVPEVHSDFIFSAFAEEAGFLGVILIFALFAVFAIHGYRAALRADTVFKRLLAASLVTMIISQVIVNVAVVSGSLPATGVPLPFFSAGGSSLLTTVISAGLIVNISRSRINTVEMEKNYAA